MDRRSFCRVLALLPLGALLAACDQPREAVPTLDPAAGPAVAGTDAPQIVATLLAADWAVDTPVGLTAGYSIREIDPDGATAVTIAFVVSYNSSHRVSYGVFDAAEDASLTYATAAAALRADARGAALTYPDAPYPATTIFYADLGRGVLLIGPIVVHILATGTNRQFFNALVSASVAHLARALAGR